MVANGKRDAWTPLLLFQTNLMVTLYYTFILNISCFLLLGHGMGLGVKNYHDRAHVDSSGRLKYEWVSESETEYSTIACRSRCNSQDIWEIHHKTRTLETSCEQSKLHYSNPIHIESFSLLFSSYNRENYVLKSSRISICLGKKD